MSLEVCPIVTSPQVCLANGENVGKDKETLNLSYHLIEESKIR